MLVEPEDFNDFRSLTAMLGQNPLFTQGAGGNTSIKHKEAMWIKASGAWLKDAAAKNIFVIVDQERAQAELNYPGEPSFRRLDTFRSMRPSIETSMHVVIPHRVLAHIHCVPMLAIAIRKGADYIFDDKLTGLKAVYVPYVKPGWELAKAVRNTYGNGMPDIFLLGNHGIVIGGRSTAEIAFLLGDITERLDVVPREYATPDISFLEHACVDGKWRLPRQVPVHSLALDPMSRAYAVGGSLFPDEIVYLGRGCYAAQEKDVPNIDPAKHPIVLVEGKGVLLAGNMSHSGEAQAECLAATLARVPPGVELNYLKKSDEDELLNWDAEKYRQQIS